MPWIARTPALLLLSVLALGLAIPAGAPPAAAQDQACDHLITLPGAQTAGYTISAPGLYCLDTDVIMAASFTAGNAIEIAANYVTLDLRGHKVHGANAGVGTRANGIHAFNRRNVTIKNGTVWGFSTGVALDASTPTTLAGYVVERVRAELNRTTGISVQGANSIVRQNVVTNTGAIDHTYGIQFRSADGRILDNDILTVTPESGHYSFGIALLGGDSVLVVGNRIASVGFAVAFISSAGKYRNNLTTNIAGIPFAGGYDAGDNN